VLTRTDLSQNIQQQPSLTPRNFGVGYLSQRIIVINNSGGRKEKRGGGGGFGGLGGH
jgi:hypothetical protein